MAKQLARKKLSKQVNRKKDDDSDDILSDIVEVSVDPAEFKKRMI